MKTNTILLIVSALIIGAGGFFVGMKYQQSQRGGQFRQLGNGQGFRGSSGVFGGRGNGFRPVAGTIIKSDATSVTLKLNDGSSKIILVSDKTQINKATTAGITDLQTGELVAVFGSENADGSITAQNIQLNPVLRGVNGSPMSTGAAN